MGEAWPGTNYVASGARGQGQPMAGGWAERPANGERPGGRERAEAKYYWERSEARGGEAGIRGRSTTCRRSQLTAERERTGGLKSRTFSEMLSCKTAGCGLHPRSHLLTRNRGRDLNPASSDNSENLDMPV